MIIPKFYEDLSVLHDNTMPARAYYIPSSSRMDDLAEHREHSDRIQFLNGVWKFRYYESIYDLADKFYETDYNTGDYDEVKVPHTWQMDGYDQQQYTNLRYPFPFDPPYVPNDNPCGCYVYDFEYLRPNGTDRTYLNFEGVDSCYYVWLNGQYIGYSQVAHCTDEYDVTDVINTGANKLAVLVLKWCDGSYVEDQDKFRMSGIFRDVYLMSRPEKAVRDYRVNTDIEADAGKAVISLDVEYYSPVDTKIVLEDMAGSIIDTVSISDNGTVALTVPNPVLWNTENSYLYTLIISTENEVIVEYVGFRTVKIEGNVLYVNGQNIKFRGVNRHESDPVTGPVVGLEQIMTDLRLMKEHNFNSIRTSHYPDVPYFYQLCDKYGFMVIDEADIESHGPMALYREEDTEINRYNHWNERIADDPVWEETILDRVKLMCIRDKNRPCIVMWSMGNENAYGCNFEKALEWTKEYDRSRVTQYESAVHSNPNKVYNYDNLDINSQMYPSPSQIREYTAEHGDKPFMMVEYGHSMGNGPGDFEDYFRLYHEDDLYCGGFVWEWCDHAIYKGKSEDGRDIFYYGGDHGEVLHDANFCMDGLMYPDRRPHTAVKEYWNVYRPARVVGYDELKRELTIHNYMDFDDLADYVDVLFELRCDGHVLEEGVVDIKSVAPHGDATVKLDIIIPERGKSYLIIKYVLKKNIPLLSVGYELGFDEVRISNGAEFNADVAGIMNAPAGKYGQSADMSLKVTEDDKMVNITSNAFEYIYDKRTSLFSSLLVGGRQLLDKPMEINVFRAPTDNDVNIKVEWIKAGYDRAYIKGYNTTVTHEESSDEVVISTHAAVVADGIQKIMDVSVNWTVDSYGRISAAIHAVKDSELPDLPRFGIRMFIDKAYNQVTYYGLGPEESYADKRRASSHGIYTAKISDMHEDYVRPQENGSHCDCDYVIVADSVSEASVAVAAPKPFSFNASVYTQEELRDKTHNYELLCSGSSVLCIDYAQNGIGSNSCGPYVYDEYRFSQKEIDFAFTIAIV